MPGDSVWGFWLWTVICILAIIGLAYWFTRHVVGKSPLGTFGAKHGGSQMKVLARMPLGKDQNLAVVQVGQRYYVLGVSPGGISLLSELSAEEAAAWETPPEQLSGAQTPNFREAFGELLKQKMRR